MKEIVLYFHKSTRKNATVQTRSYAIYNNARRAKSKFSKTMDLYDIADRISKTKYRYVSFKAFDYCNGVYFNPNDRSADNVLMLPETKRYNMDNRNDRIEFFKTLCFYMILLSADFDYTYNPFTDPNILYHIKF